MNPHEKHLDADDLAVHAVWLRRLARELVTDPHAADELAQETWVAVLRERPVLALRSPRAWLGAIVRNLARRRARSDARRREREAMAARPEAVELRDETQGRMDAAVGLLGALRRLEEPYRSTLVARYFDERSAAEIARSIGVPAATVRWRIQHGLERLRAEFVRERASAHDAVGMLVLLARAPDGVLSTSAAAAAAGVLAMHGALKLAAAAVVFAVAGLGWWAISSASDARVPAEVERPSATGPSNSRLELENERAPEAPTRDRAEEQRPTGAEHASRPTEEQHADSMARIEARLVTESGRAIAGGRIELAEIAGLPAAESGADGRVRLGLDASLLGESGERASLLTVTASGRAARFDRVRLARGTTVALGDVVLQPGVTLAGVVRFEDGGPAASVEVLATEAQPFAGLERARRTGPSTWPGAPRTRTDPAGRFVLEGVAAGERRAWAIASGMRSAASEVLQLEPLARKDDLVLVLEPLGEEDRIAGIVLTPEGEPVPTAAVTYTMRVGGGMTRNRLECDGAGRFELRLDELVPHDLTATDPRDRFAPVTRVDVPPGMLDLELRFERPRHLRLEVADTLGKTVPEFTVRLLTADGRDEIDERTSDPALGGRLSLRAPAQPFRLTVDARGFALAELGPITQRTDEELARIVLRPIPGVRGKVVFSGAAVPNARVALHEHAGTRRHALVGGFQARVLPEPTAEDVTDAEGRFFLTLRSDGEFVILAHDASSALAELGPLDLQAARGASELVVEFVSPGVIEGRILTAPSRNPEGFIVSINRGDLAPRSMRVGADGRYRFENVTPGEWLVNRTAHEAGRATGWGVGSGSEATRFRGNCTVRPGATTRFDLDLTDERPCVLNGKLTIDGTPALHWSARLHPSSGVSSGGGLPSGSTDAAGKYRLEIGEPGAYRVHLSDPSGTLAMSVQFDAELVRGEQTLERDVRTGTVEGRLMESRFHTNAFALLRGRDGLVGYAPLTCSEDGTFTLARVPAGTLTVHWTSAEGHREELGTVEVEAGATARFERR